MKRVGDRVGAIFGSDGNVVKFFGYGVYVGEEVPPPIVKFMGLSLAELGHRNPKIVLDSGKIVWGCECWWGAEVQVQRLLEGRTVVPVDIDEVRTELEKIVLPNMETMEARR